MKLRTLRLIGRALLPIFVIGQMLCAVPARAAFTLDDKARKEIEVKAQAMIDQKLTPGLAIGIMSGGKIIYSKGFGLANLETGTAVTPESVFDIGSNTKQFTAASIMLLAEQGKLGVDDQLSKYFPDFPRGNEVTLRQMLTHTSGIHPVMIPGGPPTPEQRLKIRTSADFVPVIQGLEQPFTFDPGTSWQYSNSGYILLGVIIEKVSGLSLGDFFKQNLFDRAGMTASALDKSTEVVPNRAAGYGSSPEGGGFTNRQDMMDVGTGGGGIRSTVGDMLRWQEALLSGRIISPAGVKTMTTPGTLKNGEALRMGPGGRYAFGLSAGEENGHATLSHTGGGPGFRSIGKMFPNDQVSFVVMINAGTSQQPREDRGEGPPRRPPPDQQAGESDRDPQGEPRGVRRPDETNAEPGQQRWPRRMQGPPNPVRELEAVLTDLITAPK